MKRIIITLAALTATVAAFAAPAHATINCTAGSDYRMYSGYDRLDTGAAGGISETFTVRSNVTHPATFVKMANWVGVDNNGGGQWIQAGVDARAGTGWLHYAYYEYQTASVYSGINYVGSAIPVWGTATVEIVKVNSTTYSVKVGGVTYATVSFTATLNRTRSAMEGGFVGTGTYTCPYADYDNQLNGGKTTSYFNAGQIRDFPFDVAGITSSLFETWVNTGAFAPSVKQRQEPQPKPFGSPFRPL